MMEHVTVLAVKTTISEILYALSLCMETQKQPFNEGAVRQLEMMAKEARERLQLSQRMQKARKVQLTKTA